MPWTEEGRRELNVRTRSCGPCEGWRSQLPLTSTVSPHCRPVMLPRMMTFSPASGASSAIVKCVSSSSHRMRSTTPERVVSGPRGGSRGGDMR